MSTFSGIIDEIEHISIDNFTGINLNSKLFFLSHCHTDHMKGLNCHSDLPGPLYGSEFTTTIVRRQFPNISQVKILKTGDPTVLSLPSENDGERDDESKKIVVTSIPAGHCPGSVMFLFEYNNTRVLYTGDFRLYESFTSRLVSLKDARELAVQIDVAYIDSTFLYKKYPEFPRRKHSIEKIIHLIEEWLIKNRRNVIVIRPPAYYGYEYLIVELQKKFREKIHIGSEAFKDYCYIPDFDNAFDRTVNLCGRIHICPPVPSHSDTYYTRSWCRRTLDCMPDLDEEYIRIIRPTATRWTNWKENKIIYEGNHCDNIYYVCYATHASYLEIQDFLKYLKPKIVKLNVIPSNSDQRNEMENYLQQIVDGYQSNEAKSSNSIADWNFYSKIEFNQIQVNETLSFQDTMDDAISRTRIKRRKRL